MNKIIDTSNHPHFQYLLVGGLNLIMELYCSQTPLLLCSHRVGSSEALQIMSFSSFAETRACMTKCEDVCVLALCETVCP